MHTDLISQSGRQRTGKVQELDEAILVDIKGALGLGEDVRAGMMVCMHRTGEGWGQQGVG